MENGHKDNLENLPDPIERFRKGAVGWSRTSDDVWKDIENRIASIDRPVTILNRFRYLAAASILALAVISAFLILYSRNYSTSVDQISDIVLPDNSSAKLSSNTMISYNPFTFRFSRKVRLDGEAFFNVERGNKFTVVSEPGTTEVLGTSFNILSSDNIYEVTCITGKVKVTTSETKKSEIITGDQKVILNNSGMLEMQSSENIETSTAWTRGEFYFTSEPLNDVFAKIGRSYGIKIIFEATGDLFYTGNFKKAKNLDFLLEIVCSPFGLKHEEISDGVFRIYQ